MFEHIAKRRPPSSVPFAAIAVIIIGIVMVGFMIRTLSSGPAQDELGRDRPIRRDLAAQIPELSPGLEAEVDPESKPVDVKFNWPPPCRVPAIQDTRKDGQHSRASFHVVLEPAGDRLALRMQDVELLVVNGQRADSPEIAGQLASANALTAAAMPSFIVSTTGDYLGIADLDRTLDVLAKSPALRGPEMARALDAMRTPQARAMLEQAAGSYWNAWSAAWHGIQLAPGAHLERTSEIELAGGATMKVPSTITHKGTIPGTGGLVALESVQVLEGPEAARQMLAMLRSLAAQAGGPRPPDDAVKQFRREAIVRVAIDPVTSRVHRARTTMTVEVGTQQRTTMDDIAFDWAHAEGCGAKAP